jgi:hypothetical protein
MNLMSAELQGQIAKFEIIDRIERSRSYNGNVKLVHTRRTKTRRDSWRSHA